MHVKNWEKFQHFKDRRPPWIKLYRDILEHRDITMISDRCFRVLIGCWLLASEDATMAGQLPCIRDIAFRLRLTVEEITESLCGLTEFIYQDDIKQISGCNQGDILETEVETKTEVEKKTKRPRKRATYTPEFIRFWEAYPLHKRKVKKAAGKAFAVATQSDDWPGIDVIVAALEKQCATHDWTKEGGQFVPLPTSWINGGRWDDEVGEPQQQLGAAYQPFQVEGGE